MRALLLAAALSLAACKSSSDTAPENFTVKFETTKGDILIDVHRAWAPLGADRFYELVKSGYFQDIAFFRAIDGFMVQFGIHGDPTVATEWERKTINDDPAKESNDAGMLTFATAGPNTRTTQLFINLVDNKRLNEMGFTPIGKIRDMAPVKSLYMGYGEGAPQGKGPMQGRITLEGNKYLKANFPELDYIKSASIVP